MGMTLEAIHTRSVKESANLLDVDPESGLSETEASRRLEDGGPNELEEKKRPGVLRLLLDQFNNFLIIILIVAAITSFFLGEPIDAGAILVIVILNAIMGVVQESKAEKALDALKQMSAPNARVLRDDEVQTVDTRTLVPGDVVLLQAGSSVPADLRLVETVNLRIDEAALTGESVAVGKDAECTFEEKAALGDRANCAYMGTSVAFGRGRGIVSATGMRTEMGKIAESIQSYEEEATPLQKRLNQLGKWLGVISLSICGVIFLYGLIRDTDPLLVFREGFAAYVSTYKQNVIDLFMTAVSLAIAAVPEGLPAVVTICLALGMQRMVQRHALIRKLPAVETLGTATVICTDKTGTLTQNQMTVVRAWMPGQMVEVTGGGYDPTGAFRRDGEEISPLEDRGLALLLRGALLCNDALLRRSTRGDEAEAGDGEQHSNGEHSGDGDRYEILGDPTEGALVVAATKAGYDKQQEEAKWPRVAEFPFTSARKRMTTIHRVPAEGEGPADGRVPLAAGGEYLALTKGAPDIVLERCTRVLRAGSVDELSATDREEITETNSTLAREALRVLAVAYKPLDEAPEETATDDESGDRVEQDLVFAGLLGMIDPARPEAKEAVELARRAGIRTVMVTGDYRETAAAIAREIGILRENGEVLSGRDLDDISDEEFRDTVEQVDVYARVSPEDKVRILQALRANGHVAAMTGDGVNDAPALKRADIGVAMGITGTDVSKQTSEMVLTDDNFASIVSAVEEGRVIYANISKFVYYLVSCNIGEILIIFIAMITGLVIPLTPIMLLWLNLVTDGAPALALGVEKGDPDIMKRAPRPPTEPIINAEMRLGLIVQAVVMTAAVLGSFLVALYVFNEGTETARTIAFTTLVLSELWRAFTSRSDRHSLFRIGAFGNRWMLAAVGSSIVFLLVVLYVPFLLPVFNTVPLNVSQWLRLLPFTALAAVAAEITKIFLRRQAYAAFSGGARKEENNV